MTKHTLKALFIIFTFISTTAFAQNKPVSGNVATEITVNPFSGATFLGGVRGGVKFRYFLSEKTALRLGFGVFAKNSVEKYNNPVTSQEDGEKRFSNNNLLLLPGLEFHFAGTEKLSPYIGFDAGVGYNNTKETLTNIEESGNYREDYGREKNTSSLSYNLNLAFGADYYIAPKVFIGAEVGLSAAYLQLLEAKTTYTGTAVSPFNPTSVRPDSNFSIGVFTLGGFRLGFIF